jgi:hypothetical protein
VRDIFRDNGTVGRRLQACSIPKYNMRLRSRPLQLRDGLQRNVLSCGARLLWGQKPMLTLHAYCGCSFGRCGRVIPGAAPCPQPTPRPFPNQLHPVTALYWRAPTTRRGAPKSVSLR